MLVDYKFCLKCGSPFVAEDDHLVCTACGFELYDNPRLTVNVIVRNEAGEVLFIKRKHNPYQGTWDTPGGFLEAGETAEDAARREIYEEAGVTVGKLVYFGSYPDTYEYQEITVPLLALTYIAEGMTGDCIAGSDADGVAFMRPTHDVIAHIGPSSDRQALIDYLAKL